MKLFSYFCIMFYDHTSHLSIHHLGKANIKLNDMNEHQPHTTIKANIGKGVLDLSFLAVRWINAKNKKVWYKSLIERIKADWTGKIFFGRIKVGWSWTYKIIKVDWTHKPQLIIVFQFFQELSFCQSRPIYIRSRKFYNSSIWAFLPNSLYIKKRAIRKMQKLGIDFLLVYILAIIVQTPYATSSE